MRNCLKNRRRLQALALAGALLWGAALPATWAQDPGGDAPVVMSRAAQVLAGESTPVMGRNFKPGSQVTLAAEGVALSEAPWVADEEGRVHGEAHIPAEAATGTLPVVVTADGAEVAELKLKISEALPLDGAERYGMAQAPLRSGVYQLALDADARHVFVTRSVLGAQPRSELLRVDARTLEVTDSSQPPAADAWGQPREKGKRSPPPLYMVFGAASDPAHGTLWVTNTINDTVAVYRQEDLSLLRQFDPGLVPHARVSVIDADANRAYVAAMGSGKVAAFDTATLAHLTDLGIREEAQDNASFATIGLALDAAAGRLYVSSMRQPEVAVIETGTGVVSEVWQLASAGSLRDLAWDEANGRLLAADYGGDSLLVIDPDSGQIEHAVPVGASPLAVAWEPVSGHAFVAVRGAGTVAVVDAAAGERVANLAVGSYPNHLVADGRGSVYLVNKAQGEDDAQGDQLTRISAPAD